MEIIPIRAHRRIHFTPSIWRRTNLGRKKSSDAGSIWLTRLSRRSDEISFRPENIQHCIILRKAPTDIIKWSPCRGKEEKREIDWSLVHRSRFLCCFDWPNKRDPPIFSLKGESFFRGVGGEKKHLTGILNLSKRRKKKSKSDKSILIELVSRRGMRAAMTVKTGCCKGLRREHRRSRDKSRFISNHNKRRKIKQNMNLIKPRSKKPSNGVGAPTGKHLASSFQRRMGKRRKQQSNQESRRRKEKEGGKISKDGAEPFRGSNEKFSNSETVHIVRATTCREILIFYVLAWWIVRRIKNKVIDNSRESLIHERDGHFKVRIRHVDASRKLIIADNVFVIFSWRALNNKRLATRPLGSRVCVEACVNMCG